MRDPHNGHHTAEDIRLSWYTKFKSAVPVECEFKREYCTTPPDYKGIRKWYEQLRENGKVEKDIFLHCIGDTMTTWIMFRRIANSPKKSISQESTELQMTADFFRAAYKP
jgi:hypothetical protein